MWEAAVEDGDGRDRWLQMKEEERGGYCKSSIHLNCGLNPK